MAEIIPFEIRDYLQEARDKVTYAFESSPVFDKYLQLLSLPMTELQTVMQKMMQERSISTAVGAQLDIIGNIVGQPRELISTDLIPYFGYAGNPRSSSYGDLNDLSLGGFYWDITKPLDGNVLLNDDQYRVFIRAKILKNVTRATPEDVIAFIKFVFSVDRVYLSIDSSAEALILVSDDISQFEKALLQYHSESKNFDSYFIPKTLGVKYSFGIFPKENFFSFAGVPGGGGYGTLLRQGGSYNGENIYDGTVRHDTSGGLLPGFGGTYASLLEDNRII